MASLKGSVEVMKCVMLVSITVSALVSRESIASGISSVPQTLSIVFSISNWL